MVTRQVKRSGRRKAAGWLFRPALFCLLLTACCLLPSGGVWTKQKSGTLAWLHAVYFLDERRGWAVGGKGALLSTQDGGEHWQLRKSPTEDALHDVYFADERTGWLVCERSIYLLKTVDEPRSYLLHTTDGGETWRRVEAAGKDIDARLIRVVFADRERGFVFGELGSLYATEDGGKTWARQRIPTSHLLLGGTFLDPQQGWIVGAGATLLQTIDGGATWREGRIENAAITRPQMPGAATVEQTLPSASSSAAAPPRVNATRLNAVSFVDARSGWTVGTGGRIYATANGGRTWRSLASPTTADLLDVKFFDRSEGWAVGTGGTLIHTTDGGANWTVEQTNTTHPLERLSFAGRRRGWAVGFGGTIVAYAHASPEAPISPPKLGGGASLKHGQ
jgi:photosystem II stability/assembly factor-like uncharacterized protein